MLHHHGGAGSSPSTDATPFSLPPPPTGPVSFTSIQRPRMQLQPARASYSEELPAVGSSGSGAANLRDDDMPGGAGDCGAGASGSGSNRWPREETLALIRIRSEMDATFRSAPLKAPLWEDVARKLAGLGYRRSAKKCKEKFENVDKYYRRTKDARAGRQDGKSYRFFSELEALHAAAPQQQHHQGGVMTTVQADDPQPSATAAWTTQPAAVAPPGAAGLPELSFSSMSESGSESDEEEEGEGLGRGESDGGGCDKELMALFEGMMRQVAQKQDAMLRAFLETLERWEAERTAREEAWRRQEVARMSREREQLARERAAAASRDAALIAFLQRVGGGGLPPPSTTVAVSMSMAVRPTPPSPRHDTAAVTPRQPAPVPPKPEEAVAWAGGGESGGSTSSRWPKEEVQALIQLRAEKDEEHYHHDAASKGPLWEDIAAGMRRIGYSRSAKRCKEKWENINKYYKKVKESNKRRPEDSKTCPYFHQLDAMYRNKRFAGRGGTAPVGANTAADASGLQENPSQREHEGKSSNDFDKRNDRGEENVHAPPSYGDSDLAPTATAVADGNKNKKDEDISGETNEHRRQLEFAAEETDSDDMGGNYTDEDKMQYTMGFQKPNANAGGSAPAPTQTAEAPTSSAAPTSSTFLAVQ